MRVAALNDVHGNVHALEAVLADVEAARPDAIVFGGDIVAGPFPRETLALVRSLDAICVRGNADELDRPWAAQWEPERLWLREQLPDGDRAWLGALPFSWAADETLYVHANPHDVHGIVTHWTPDEQIAGYLDGLAESRVVGGHVHMQFEREVGGRRWICAGSVGLPYEREPGAYWALLEPDTVEFRRAGYDGEAAAAAIRATSHPQAEELAAGRVLAVPPLAEVEASFRRLG